jgi:hypothetical protein
MMGFSPLSAAGRMVLCGGGISPVPRWRGTRCSATSGRKPQGVAPCQHVSTMLGCSSSGRCSSTSCRNMQTGPPALAGLASQRPTSRDCERIGTARGPGVREEWDYDRTRSPREPHEAGLREDRDCERTGTGPRNYLGGQVHQSQSRSWRSASIPLLPSCLSPGVLCPVGPPETQWLLAAPSGSRRPSQSWRPVSIPLPTCPTSPLSCVLVLAYDPQTSQPAVTKGKTLGPSLMAWCVPGMTQSFGSSKHSI